MAGLAKEELVGISEYLNKDNPGFRGSIKECVCVFNELQRAIRGCIFMVDKFVKLKKKNILNLA